MSLPLRFAGICHSLILVCCAATSIQGADSDEPDELIADLRLETHVLDDQEPHSTITLLSAPSDLAQRPVILMLGTLKQQDPPFWSLDLLREGYLLAAFMVDHPPDPDPARRPQWLVFDQRFAHGYVQGGARAPQDAGRVMDYLIARGDVHPDKFGWMGSSSTGIPGLAVATREPRLKAIVAFVSTGAYEQWLQTWHTNGLWRGETNDLWPETRELLKWDPIRHVEGLYPTAVLMVSGGEDKVVDPDTARAFVDAARPYYESDPERLRLVVYEGFGHNLPRDVVQMYTEHWFHRYLHPTQPPPGSDEDAKTLGESTERTEINATPHRRLIEGKR